MGREKDTDTKKKKRKKEAILTTGENKTFPGAERKIIMM